jgi:hypothetical protein
MTAFPVARPDARALISSLAFTDFEVSWAGPSLRTGLFGFGSEDGRILFTDLNGDIQVPAKQVAPSGEAINGVAFLQRWMGVSTRAEVMLWTPPRVSGESSRGARIPAGAHDIIAGQSGYFFAPLGQNGFLFCRPSDGREQVVTVSSGQTEDVYFYRLISLQSSSGEEIVAAATRRGGVAALEFN